MKADLHMHSTASDGEYSPAELVRAAAQSGVTLMALTDHDSAEGVEEARLEAQRQGIMLLAGVEMGCGSETLKEIHVLGYGIDGQDEAFAADCRRFRQKRIERAENMVSRLCSAGVPISMERVRELAGGVVARPHVARVLVEAGHASSVKDAFDRYLVPGRCGYVPRERLTVAQAAQMIRRAGGVPVLAHPMELGIGDMRLAALVHEWKQQGIAGLEVYHPSAGNQHIPMLLDLAKREGLLITGGSDFHGEGVRGNRIGQEAARWRSMEEDAAAMLEEIQKQTIGL